MEVLDPGTVDLVAEMARAHVSSIGITRAARSARPDDRLMARFDCPFEKPDRQLLSPQPAPESLVRTDLPMLASGQLQPKRIQTLCDIASRC